MRFSFLALLVACSSPFLRPEPEQLANQDIFYRSGIASVASRGSRSTVVARPVTSSTGRYTMKTRIDYVLAIRNSGPDRVDVGEASVTAVANTTPVHVFTAIEIEDLVQRDASVAQTINLVTGALRIYVARSNTQRAAAVEDTVENQWAIEASRQERLGRLSVALQRTTLDPGDSVVGVVEVEAERRQVCPHTVVISRENQVQYQEAGPCRWTISVRVGDDVHVFVFNERP